MADHNDPNAVNSIFSDIDVSPADVFDMFGYPGDASSNQESVVLALTFAPVPEAGVLAPRRKLFGDSSDQHRANNRRA